MPTAPTDPEASHSPARSALVLGALVAVATVANLNLAVANVALPDIGLHFESSQTVLNLISVGFSLGLAGTVLYLGAVGDRYGRKSMLAMGMILTIPTSLLAAWAPSAEVLFVARLLGGVAAGMAYPTTLALITALWSGPARTKSIAIWSAFGGAAVAFASLIAGWLLTMFWWGSVFVLTVPLAAICLVAAWILVPAHVNETTEKVDHLGGVYSIIGIIALVLAINFAPTAGEGKVALISGGIALVVLAAFFIRQKQAENPLFDLTIARRRIFWVAATAGLIVFGTLMGAIFVGQQYLQNVLGYSTLKAGAATLPAAFAMLLVAPQSAKLVASRGSRFTLLAGYAAVLVSFVVMLVTWTENSGLLPVCVAFVFLGIGVGLAGTPASHSLTGSVPVHRAGMASGTADLQRDLGGSIMQSILGAILSAGYAAAVATKLGASGQKVTEQTASLLERSYSSAAVFAQKLDPSQQKAVINGARSSFLSGANWAYLSGIFLVLGGAALVAFAFPKRNRESELLSSYEAEDAKLNA